VSSLVSRSRDARRLIGTKHAASGARSRNLVAAGPIVSAGPGPGRALIITAVEDEWSLQAKARARRFGERIRRWTPAPNGRMNKREPQNRRMPAFWWDRGAEHLRRSHRRPSATLGQRCLSVTQDAQTRFASTLVSVWDGSATTSSARQLQLSSSSDRPPYWARKRSAERAPEAKLRSPFHPVTGSYAVTAAPVRGSSTTIAVFPERSAAQPSYWSLNSTHRAQSRSRSSPSAARPRT
jgi:hypothetical protein